MDLNREGDQDAADAARVLRGDTRAYEGIVERWQIRLVNLAWRFCRDRDLAEDMAQEAFIRAFKSLAAFRGDSSFSTWLTAIAINVYRSRVRKEGLPLLTLDLTARAAYDHAILDGIIKVETAELVRRAVLTLPPKYKEAILLYYFEERSVSAAAVALGIAEGTLKARLHRARGLLERRCRRLGIDEEALLRDELR